MFSRFISKEQDDTVLGLFVLIVTVVVLFVGWLCLFLVGRSIQVCVEWRGKSEPYRGLGRERQ